MLKHFLLLLCICCTVSAFAQFPGSYVQPNSSRGQKWNGIVLNREIYPPRYSTASPYSAMRSGAFYYDTTAAIFRYWNGSAWLAWTGIGGGGGSGQAYYAGWGLIKPDSVFRVDSVLLATRLRMYKVGDSLNALNTLATVVNRGRTANAIAITEYDTSRVPLEVTGSVDHQRQFRVSAGSTELFGVNNGFIYALPFIAAIGGVEATGYRNFGNSGSNLPIIFNIQGGSNTDTTGRFSVIDNQNAAEMIAAEEGSLYFPHLTPPLADKMLIIRTGTGKVDTADIGSGGGGGGDYVNRTGTNTVTANSTWSGTNAYTNTITVPSNTVGTTNTQAATTALVKYSIDSLVLQIRLTSLGASYTVPNSIATRVDLFIDPASTVASFTLYMPLASNPKQEIKVFFGEDSRISNGNTVVSEFNVYNNDASEITSAFFWPATTVTGDRLSFTANSFTGKWHN